MGLFDKLLGRGNSANNDSKDISVLHEEKALADMSDIEKAIAERGNFDLSKLKKIPLTNVAAIGGVFAQAVPMIQTAVNGGNLANGSIARIVFPDGVTGSLATLNSTGEFIGGIMKSGGGFAQARLKPVGMDPATITVMAMAGMIVEINQKLDDIQKTQQEILSFLQEKERADSQASLNMLEDILKRYPYNWNNDNFRRNFHAKALDIKHDADAKLILYQKQIAEKIKGLPAVYLDAAVQDAMKQLQKLFHDYSMALYLFSFASYLEVMLDGRFVAEDLKIVADKVHDYQENYDRQFEQCRDYVKKFSGGSVEMMVAGGIANAAKGLGKLIGSAPILKDGPVDEWLQNCGEQIEKANEEKVAKLAESFVAEQKTGSEIFESSIRNVDELSNQVKGMLFDEEYLYLVA